MASGLLQPSGTAWWHCMPERATQTQLRSWVRAINLSPKRPRAGCIRCLCERHSDVRRRPSSPNSLPASGRSLDPSVTTGWICLRSKPPLLKAGTYGPPLSHLEGAGVRETGSEFSSSLSLTPTPWNPGKHAIAAGQRSQSVYRLERGGSCERTRMTSQSGRPARYGMQMARFQNLNATSACSLRCMPSIHQRAKCSQLLRNSR